MDLKGYGEQLRTLRKQAGLSQEQLVDALTNLAQAGAPEEVRVVDGTLISRWEAARVQKGRQWKPTRTYVLYLISIFSDQLDLESARTWATQAGYQISPYELRALSPVFEPVPAHTGLTTGAGNHEISQGTIPHNLPAPLTSFVGREDEIAALTQYLRSGIGRLITIVGEGGVGKTRLVLAFAQSLLALPVVTPEVGSHSASAKDHQTLSLANQLFPDGIWFVALAGLDPSSATSIDNQLASAIAKTISFSFGRTDLEPAAQLLHHLRPKAQLLILDDFENLLAGTPFVLDLLQHAPQVRVLVTSRIPLNCQAERLLKLPGLPVAREETQAALDLPSVQLFVERARQQSADFSPSAQALREVSQLCRLVNGNPLAVELAAHWVQHFTVAEMVEILQKQDSFLLVTDQQDVPLRHRSMEVVFETSWQLLPPISQQNLASLAVLRGTFSREAAWAVAGATPMALADLVNRSLLHVEQESSRQKSYVVHELLRQFALAKLMALDSTQPGLAQMVYKRHSDYYLRFIAERAEALYGRQIKIANAEIQAAIDNIRAAWQWAVNQNNVEAIADAWLGLCTFYHVRSLFQEGEEVFRQAATQVVAPTLSAELQIAQAFFLNLLHRYDKAIAVVRSAVALLQGQESSATMARAQLEWGIALSLQSKPDEALGHLTEAIHLARAQQRPAVEARAQRATYRVLLAKGDVAGAIAVLEQALHYYQQLGYYLQEGFVFRSLAHVTLLQGEYRKALSYWERCLAIYQTSEDQPRTISILLHLGELYDALDDLGRAYHYCLSAYTQREESQDSRHATNTIAAFGRLMGRLGEVEQARHYMQQALAYQQQLGNDAGVIDGLCTLGWVHQQAGDAVLALARHREALEMSRASNAPIHEATALLGIAKAQAALGHREEAIGVCQESLSIRRKLARKVWVLEALSELASLYLTLGHNDLALVQVEEILDQLDAAALHGSCEPLLIYLTCYQVLQANHDPRAEQLLGEAYQRLQTQAATLEDEALRQSFLGNVFVNHTVAALYERSQQPNHLTPSPI